MWLPTKIPQTCYFYWGNTSLSFLNYLSLVSFKEHNPDWKAVLVQPSDDLVVKPPTDHHSQGYVGEKDYMHQALRIIDDVIEIDFEEVLNFKKDLHDVQRADIVRLYVLSKYGGMWSDMDILYIKPNTSIDFSKYLVSGVEKELDTVVCYQNANAASNYNSTGALFSSKNNPMYTFLLNDARDRINALGENKVGDYQMVGPSILNDHMPNIFIRMPQLNVANMAYKVFYPWGWWDSEIEGFFNRKNENRITNETIAIHWFKGNPNSAKYLNIDVETLDKSTYFGYYTLKYKDHW